MEIIECIKNSINKIDQQIQPKAAQYMSKQKLAEMVMQKMQEKKQRQQRNRPHRQVLQLLVQFQVEDYNSLQLEIAELNKQVQKQQQLLDQLQQFNQEYENTGKKDYPRIIVKPEFIASEHVEALVKEFFRKASNTFLREDLLRKKHYESDSIQFQELQSLYEVLKEKQNQIRKQEQIEHKTTNDKRVRNLKEDLRLRSIRQEQQDIRKTIAEEKQKYKSLLAEYELKKTNLHKRQQWAEDLVTLIQKQKKTIEHTYNPVTYRDYLKNIFNIRTKNQSIQLSLAEANKKVNEIQGVTEKKAEFLEKNDHLFIQGKCSDSPSKKKRFSLGLLQKQKQNKIAPKYNSLLFNFKKSILNEGSETPKKTRPHHQKSSKSKSFSTSVGKTTPSSMKNLLGQSSADRFGQSFTSELKKPRNPFHNAKLFS